MADVMHGPKALDDRGRERKSYLHAFIDSAVRFVPGCAFRFGERAVDFEGVFKSAIRKHGLPRTLYVDLGAAQTADSLRLICGELGVHLRHCRPYDPQAKAGIERFFRSWRAEIGDELPDESLPIAELNGLTWAWLSTEYHRRPHGGTGRVPLDHWLEEVERLRPAPSAERLERIFLHRETRLVRRDGTVRFRGQMLEVRGELMGMTVELRFDPEVDFQSYDRTTWPAVYVDNRFVCDAVVLDPLINSAKPRHRLPTPPVPRIESSGLNPLRQMADEQARLGRPPQDLPSNDNEE
jgi:hypothetical protein